MQYWLPRTTSDGWLEWQWGCKSVKFLALCSSTVILAIFDDWKLLKVCSCIGTAGEKETSDNRGFCVQCAQIRWVTILQNILVHKGTVHTTNYRGCDNTIEQEEDSHRANADMSGHKHWERVWVGVYNSGQWREERSHTDEQIISRKRMWHKSDTKVEEERAERETLDGKLPFTIDKI